MKPRFKPTRVTSSKTLFDRLISWISVLFLGMVIISGVTLWSTFRVNELNGHKQVVDSLLRVLEEPITLQDTLRMESGLKAFYKEGRFFRLSFPNGVAVIWPREIFSSVWSRPSSYQTRFSLGDDQFLNVEYWAPQDYSTYVPLFVSMGAGVLGLGGLLILVFFILKLRADVFRLESYVLDSTATVNPRELNFTFFQELAQQILEKEAERKLRISAQAESFKLNEISVLASQLAHDIRAPLAALSMVERQLSGLPVDVQNILRDGIKRIREIADHLLIRYRPGLRTDTEQESRTGLPELIDAIIAEKRIQLRTNPHIKLLWTGGAECAGICAKLQGSEFKRILSNLINNSIEAIGEASGIISVSLSRVSGRIQVGVSDNGSGIPKEILNRVCERGFSFNKVHGSGLGLNHARQRTELWGGKLVIESELGSGTTVIIDLPEVESSVAAVVVAAN